MAKNESEVYFALASDDFDPDQITKFLQIEPTKIKRKEKSPNSQRKFNSWILSTGNIVDNYIDIYQMSSKITEILAPKTDLIIKAIEKFQATPKLQIVIWFAINDDVPTPSIGFDTSTVEFLAKIGASIDIDTYKH